MGEAALIDTRAPDIVVGPHDSWYSLHWPPMAAKALPEGFCSGDALPAVALERKLREWAKLAEKGEAPGILLARRIHAGTVLRAAPLRPLRYRVSGSERANAGDFGFLTSCAHSVGAKFRHPLFFIRQRQTQRDRFPLFLWEDGVCLV